MGQMNADDVALRLKAWGIPNPSSAQINMFVGMDVIGGSADAAIAEYVNFEKAEATRQASDPLKAYQEYEQKFAQDSFANAQNLYTQLNDVVTSAPKLFGSLTPDQIQQYLAPLKTSFDAALATTQGALAGRGLGGSSTEANAAYQTEKQFQEQVLQTGLDVGMNTQKQQAAAIQARLNQVFQGGTTAQGAVGAAASQRSQQDLSQSNLLASLPYFLRSSGMQEAQAKIASDNARRSQRGFQATFNQVTGDIAQGADAFESLAFIPQQFKTSPGSTYSGTGSTGYNPFASPASFGPGGSSAPQNPLSLIQQNPEAALFAAG